MCYLVKFLSSLTMDILIFIYFIYLYKDTKKDIFQKPFEEGEKEELFILDLNTTIIDRKCELNEYVIMNPSAEKLGDVFDLNINSIHKDIIILLIINIIIFITTILFLILFYICRNKEKTIIFLTFFYAILIFALSICHIVFIIRAIFSFYTGDTYRFVKFLSCPNANKEGFNKYLYAEKLYKDFKFFIIINIVSFFLRQFNTNGENDEKDNS